MSGCWRLSDCIITCWAVLSIAITSRFQDSLQWSVWLKYYRAWADYGVELCCQLRFKTFCNGLAEILSGMDGLWPWLETLSGMGGLWPWRGAATRVAIDRSRETANFNFFFGRWLSWSQFLCLHNPVTVAIIFSAIQQRYWPSNNDIGLGKSRR